jgi:hypothetical protein
MDYSQDPLYTSQTAIKNLTLTFHDGCWWHKDKKCVPRPYQHEIIEYANRMYKDADQIISFVHKNFWWPQMRADMKLLLPKPRFCIYEGRIEVQMLSFILNKLVRNPDIIYKIHHKNLKRLEKIIDLNNSYHREATLMRKFVITYSHMKILAIEYSIDDGLHNRQQNGDIIMLEENTMYIVECKSIKALEERRQKVKEQATICAKRITSWIQHLSIFDDKFVILKNWNIIPAIFTEEDSNMVTLNAS